MKGMLRVKLASWTSMAMTALGRRAENGEDSYSLRLFDEELLTFSMSNSGLSGLTARIVSVNWKKKHLLPPSLALSGEGITRWLKRRVIPKNRAFVHKILQSMGLNIDDTKGIIDVCKGLSLNDSYWVVPAGFEGSFSDYNLYDNRFSEVLSLIAYTGAGRLSGQPVTSPEFTTHGMLRKAWHYIEGDGIYLFKGGTEGAANAGREPYSEYYASQIAAQMGLHAVQYDIVKWKGLLASKCKLFTDKYTAYIPAGHLVESGGIEACLKFYTGISSEALDELKSMLVFDALIYNEDRHYGNFGVLMESKTGRIYAAAPIFDNGVSLFNYAMPEDYKHLDDYAKTRGNPYGVPYEVICREVMGATQREQLKRMIGFTFIRNKQYNLPEKHLKAIEKQINLRVRELLSLPKKPQR